MSAIRIILGIACGVCVLALGFATAWYWSLPIWLAPVVLLGGVAIFASIRTEARRRAMLRPHWNRGCMGIRWRRRFPTSPKVEIRRFLDFFLDAFGFPARRRSYFSPDDKILDVLWLIVWSLRRLRRTSRSTMTSISPACGATISLSESFMLEFTSRPNQTMKPTAPLRSDFSVLATTPYRGLSLSR